MATQKIQDYNESKTEYKTLCNIRKLTLLPLLSTICNIITAKQASRSDDIVS